MGLLRDLNPPLPRTLRSRRLDSLSYPELEEVVLQSYVAEHCWLRLRRPGLMVSSMNKCSHNLQAVEFLEDRWVISIPTTSQPVILDTQENPPKLYEPTSYPSFNEAVWAASVVVDPRQDGIIVGLWQ